MSFVNEANEYAQELVKRKEKRQMTPLDRLEPDTVIVDFIRHLTQNINEVESDLYLCKNAEEGDNSDNGHHIIKLKK